MPIPAEFVDGAPIESRGYTVRRADLVRYAGASGDFNPIHWNDRFAQSVGLPGVIAHGMLTMALAGRRVSELVEDAADVLELGVRFTRPVVVPDDDDGTVVTVAVSVSSVAEGLVHLDLEVTCMGERVLGMARAVVRQ